mmetsp:Transcript_6275/g.7950  ORF Transcript_6275/g.7950 Transcript_6275/m.7950 type:complete len:254 (+) Transcript_6275:68-829(+)
MIQAPKLIALFCLLSSCMTVTNGFTIPSNTHVAGLGQFSNQGAMIRTQTKGRSLGDPLYMMDTDVITHAWSAYNVALEENPLITKSITAGVILGAADFAGQAFERGQLGDEAVDQAVDYGRVARFAFFGLILQAPWNHFYYQLLDGALPPTEDPFTATTGIKVVIDQFVQAPIFTVLIFFFLGILEGKTVESIKDQLDRDYKDTMFANWKLWVPATMVNIAFCPPILRVLFLNCVFFFWSIFLSVKLNNDTEE